MSTTTMEHITTDIKADIKIYKWTCPQNLTLKNIEVRFYGATTFSSFFKKNFFLFSPIMCEQTNTATSSTNENIPLRL